ncbi:ScyD/ScyE family protein [Intrasporangium chromatireducens]|uniref:ScyD/ScyE family protein n=1 Tax=Intrasporangium chromatireducens TaxID=1386088 RepID=UPI0004ACA3E2|nr:ScyD/ScyE family protein [Intrasporangium chromatireducens]
MTHRARRRRITVAALSAGLVGTAGVFASAGAATAHGRTSDTRHHAPTVIATGLNNPRQLAFSPEGELYVAEAGTTGTSNCQTSPEFGTVCVGLTGSVARIGEKGHVNRVVTGLPSSGTASEPIGPSDLVFTGNHEFALVIGLGGSPTYRAGFGSMGRLLGTVVKVDLHHRRHSPKVKKVFDVAGYEAKNNPDGTDIDSNGVGIARTHKGFVVADAGANDVISTRRHGSTVAVLAPVPTTKPVSVPGGPTLPAGFPADAVPTDVVRGPDGAWYVSQLVGFPFEKGASSIWRIVPGHAPQKWATGLTNVTSLAFDHHGRLYAVEIAANGLLSGPTGDLVRIKPHSSTHSVVAGNLFAPYGVAIRGSSAYVTTGSTMETAPGTGQVIKIHL